MKMLDAKECEKAVEEICQLCRKEHFLRYGKEGLLCAFQAFDNTYCDKVRIFKQLIKEHFEPQPYKFEDLKKGIWVWDDVFKEIGYIYSIANKKEIYIEYLESHCANNHYQTQPFEENRFYPVNTKSYVSRKGI